MLFATILALGIHGLLFGMEFSWLRNKLPSRPEPRILTMSLTYREPQNTKPKHVIGKPDVPPKKIVLPKKNGQKKATRASPNAKNQTKNRKAPRNR